ncbi:hypothetical protein LIER_29945 [Lithospermum erythrorhizon]|uniref:Integrase zinc-binding domain-containing protein n=1 Tax=Lithospermum erythrorhizon TaxID=34254 RepID=A0AAV3RPW6_LITER
MDLYLYSYIHRVFHHPKGSRAGILIQGPEGLQFEYVLRFLFKTTNNEAEYETMVTGLLLAQSLSITRMVVRGDSKLDIKQIRGDCGVKSGSLKKYHVKETSLTTRKVSQLELLMYCVPGQKNQPNINDVHEGDCGHHFGGRALASKITRAGYYWPTLMADSLEYVKKCDSCQKMTAVPKQPVVEMTPVLCAVPFAMWGIDLVGQFVKPATK